MLSVRRLVVAVLSLCVVWVAACQTSPPDHREANKQVMRDLYAALDAQDYDRLNTLMQPGTVLNLVGSEDSVPWDAVVSEMIPSYYNAFQGYHHVVDQFVAEGDWVVARVTFSGTHTGEFQGVAPTGNSFAYGGVHMARVSDGKIQEFWLLEDDLGLMRQLGMDLAPKAAGT